MPRRRRFTMQRKPPRAGINGRPDPEEERQYQRRSFEEIRDDLVEMDAAAGPDFRDKVTFQGRTGTVRIPNTTGFEPDTMVVVSKSRVGADARLVRADGDTLEIEVETPGDAQVTFKAVFSA